MLTWKTWLRGMLICTALTFTPRQVFAGACDDLISPSVSQGRSHPITAEDLIGLRDFGPMDDGYVDDAFLGLSPDRSKVAFQLRRARPNTNDYCFGIVVVDLAKPPAATLIATGGEYVRNVVAAHGFPAFTAGGQPSLVLPKWSKDGKWIAYLRQDNGRVQAWRAAIDGSVSAQVTHADFDVESVEWGADDKALFISGRPGLSDSRRNLTLEAGTGYRYDDRYLPLVGSVPLPRDAAPIQRFVANIESGQMWPSNGDGEDQSPAVQGVPTDALLVRLGGTWRYWARRENLQNIASPLRLFASTPDGVEHACSQAECNHILGVWLVPNDWSVVYARREGTAFSETALYRWAPGGPPREILKTPDVLTGCDLADGELICGRDGATQPRQLVAINIGTGGQRILFDPNPAVKSWTFGSVQRLYWRNAQGVETFGDLVLPPDHKPGQQHPMIVVQYSSRGFLRGGTGDEYPIQLFANHGYAVLSFQMPMSLGSKEGGRTWDEIAAKDRKDWSNRWSVQSALQQGIEASVATDTVDRARIGLTGLSDGATTVQFALIHSDLFKAAAIGSCCSEPSTVSFLVGPVLGKWLHSIGYPSLMAPDDTYWSLASMHANAAKIDTPLLMQLPDREYLGSLETFTALREMKVPVDLYVYPDENHVKWQPSHRLASFNRSLQWFDFWLLNREDEAPVQPDQYANWRELRRQYNVTPPPAD